mmetsp:Transcript_5220/g.11626  ORF Transcript_5220/g.11626 Transcript_5220/m.11626 type:complete len:312 (+) Transcript_5220:949-1884(+)
MISEARELLHHIRLENLHREERNQPHHRPHLQRHSLARGLRKDVIVELIFLVPQTKPGVQPRHCVGDEQEVLEELRCEAFVDLVLKCELDGDPHHAEAVESHPTRAIRLVDEATGGQVTSAVEDAYVVQAQEAALKDVPAFRILAVHPPREVDEQLLEHLLQEHDVTNATSHLPLHLEDAPRRPGMHRRVHVAEVPLEGRQLSVRMHVALIDHEAELVLGEARVHQRQRQAVEGEVPGGVPGELPLVRHGDDVAVEHVVPISVPDAAALLRHRLAGLVALEEEVEVVVVELLGPDHPRQRLPLNELGLRIL